ncbi:hypothetical protein L210DRAFT_3421137 [Boletus edulis BED1]|uniref:DUF6830 domain-containing protein n=1 Tax=Boletus edulis BED1 TaxID=1328754 RepID=A0AAD4BES1_BOLED|nr:hypothetical protein L210DRAFT_3421137 [Boletus edulis BED1]
MPRCPSCGRGGFKDHHAVAMHMSQPKSGCNTWVNNLVHLQESLALPSSAGRPRRDATPDATVPMDIDQEFPPPDSLADSYAEPDNPNPSTWNHSQCNGFYSEQFEGAAQSYGHGDTFMDKFNRDEFSDARKSNLYYPFACRNEWELALWLLRSGLSMKTIDAFLSLPIVKLLSLSFSTARDLRGRAELLPSGPRWRSTEIKLSHPTKHPVLLYWRDALECIAWIFNHPSFRDQLDLIPERLYTSDAKLCRVYTEWMTGDEAWHMQSQLPEGVTLIGTILSSDKTNITNICGGRVAHPLLISLANIKMSTRLKLSSRSFMLTALLPVPKFVHKNKRMRGVLGDRLIHQCLDIVLDPVTKAAQFGFGDPFRHEPRTAATTLAQLSVVKSKVDPADLQAFFREAQRFRLNGVSDPFWRNFPLSCPSIFITPELLHYIHKESWDHDVQWCLNIAGESEVDFPFSILQPTAGSRHFKGGISKLNQVTGRVHRDVQRYLIGIIACAAPSEVTAAIPALMDFRYRVQAYRISDDDIHLISAALSEFHANKDTIIEHGGRLGKGKKVINNWHIPKLELMQGIAPSIKRVGVTIQWTADTTEHAHVSEIKTPAGSTNNNNYDPQICRYLDRAEKCRAFELATSLHEQEDQTALLDSGRSEDDRSDLSDDEDNDNDNAAQPFGPSNLARPSTNYFTISARLSAKQAGTIPSPLRSFVVGSTAVNLSYAPSLRRISVDEAAQRFGLPDLRPALADFLQREAQFGAGFVHPIGGQRRGSRYSNLPFTELQVWYKVRLQNKPIHGNSDVSPAQTLFCTPPSSGAWALGHYDAAIFNVDARSEWPESGLEGHIVGQFRLVMRPLGKTGEKWPWTDRFIAYVQRFDIGAEDVTQLPILKRAKRASGERLGDVVPLSQVRVFAHLIPRFGATADTRLTAYNSFEHSTEFYLNKYFDKNTYFALT